VAIVATGAAFDLVTINLFRGEHRTPAFQKLNPFCTAPVLEDGDEVIPETGAILLHFAERFPSARLLPTGKQERQSALLSRDNQNRVAATISDTSIGGISLRWAAGCQVRSRHRRWPERPDFTGGCPPQMLGRRCYLKLNILIPAVAV